MNIKIFRLLRSPRLSGKTVTRLARTLLDKEGCAVSRVHVILADDAYLRDLNRTFFHKDRPTNVISFNLGELAEVYVSLEQARDRSEAYYYIAHGLLHVAGYDHATRAAEDRMNRKSMAYARMAFRKRGVR